MEKIINLAIIQARMGSSRLPDKVLMDLEGEPVLKRVIERVNKSKLIDKIIIATTTNSRDDAITKFCDKNKQECFRGSEIDVLDRYFLCAKQYMPTNVIRITADCPLIDSEIIDNVIIKHIEENNDYTSNTIDPTFPDGLDTEVFKFQVLEDAWANAKLASQREHVTQYIVQNPKYRKGNLTYSKNLEDQRWTLDTQADLEFIKKVYHKLYKKNPYFSMQDVLELLVLENELTEINFGQERNEGLMMSLKKDYIMK